MLFFIYNKHQLKYCTDSNINTGDSIIPYDTI